MADSSPLMRVSERFLSSARAAAAARLSAYRVQTLATDEDEAVAEVYAGMAGVELSGLIFFCSPRYDLGRLADRISTRFRGVPTIGCTSAGQIGPLGFRLEGMVAVGLSSRDLTMTTYEIQPVGDRPQERAAAVGEGIQQRRAAGKGWPGFGLLLVDGLSMVEEQLVSALYQSMGDVPLVGGSAGDDLAFARTHVYHHGRFVSDAAVLALFETCIPFRAFKFQHVAASNKLLVITAADPDRRIVHEINGKRAAEGYAELVGVPVDQLDASVFSRSPVVMDIAGDPYVRAIRAVNGDGSLSFFCAIEEGLVLSLGTSTDAAATARAAFQDVRRLVSAPQVVLGCDCILRRLGHEQRGELGRLGDIMVENRVVGFSTYGEQYNAIHVNQTFTGVAIGG